MALAITLGQREQTAVRKTTRHLPCAWLTGRVCFAAGWNLHAHVVHYGVRVSRRIRGNAPRWRRQERLQVPSGCVPMGAVQDGRARVRDQLQRRPSCTENSESEPMGRRAAALGHPYLPARGHDGVDPLGAVRLDAAHSELFEVCTGRRTPLPTATDMCLLPKGAWCRTCSGTSPSSPSGSV